MDYRVHQAAGSQIVKTEVLYVGISVTFARDFSIKNCIEIKLFTYSKYLPHQFLLQGRIVCIYC